ncbi:selenocysteine-specific translation elongation factor [Kocuria sp.]|uniref:selenocysteine-specific translation elongation factor n=1 Tax=Kocuria sp. TaxID=1871328 RepID=UPI0026DFAFD0|nr:selenocysteine-specific translation elongation factor [Kocuria sp.]MDO5618061.1 selenocysteine-specific translation elongation factor [Kocuria sp.]
MNHVVATAGHVDHGKSTLVRALTGIEPDRWAEEKRRGLTIDLGFAWTTLPSGREVSFVDVPGHERFLGNMLAGLGPAPVVCFVVAVDEGWQAQSSDHRDAVAALGITRGVIVLSRIDKAPDLVEAVTREVRRELADTGLRDAPVAAVSAVDGTGLDQLRDTLDRVLAQNPVPHADQRVRLWVDRAFSIKGAGTVATGTLGSGALAVGQSLTVISETSTSVTIRGLQSHKSTTDQLLATTRAAVNLRGVSAGEINRGDVLVTPGAWPTTQEFDLHRTTGPAFTQVPSEVVLHVGSAGIPAHLRPFDDHHARLRIERHIPVIPGDRVILRYPAAEVVLGGGRILDINPYPLSRRGDSARHTAWLRTLPDDGDASSLVIRHGAVSRAHLMQLGLLAQADSTPDSPEVQEVAGWWIHQAELTRWVDTVRAEVATIHARSPMAPGMAVGAVPELLGITDSALVKAVIGKSGLTQNGGYLAHRDHQPDLGPAELGLQALEKHLAVNPFDSPEAHDLTRWGLGSRELATAERLGRIVRVGGGVVVLPNAPALAMRELARLEQPFTASQARLALGTTRRVAIPLLEHLDARGWTQRVDGTRRTIRR